MKKLVFGIALMAMTVFSACAQRFCPESDFEVELVEGGGSVRIVRYVGNSFDVRIPPMIGGSPVTHIGEGAFAGMNWDYDGEEWIVGHQLTSVTIPDSVTYIGTYAFGWNQLTSVTIPNSVRTIGWGAFDSNQLANVYIGNNVTSIGGSAFFRNKITSVTIPNSVTSIGQAAFVENQLTNVIIGNRVSHIGNMAFFHNQLTSVAIPDSVTYIGTHAFGRNQLTNVIIGNGVTNVGRMAFEGNPLTSLTINMTNIPGDVFSFSRLTSVTIGNNVTSIGNNAFANNRLTNVTIPSNVTHIGYRAFFGNQLTSVAIANGVTHIGNLAFSHNQNQRQFFIIPPAIEEDKMIALLDRVSLAYRGRIRAAFRLYDIDNLHPADDRIALLHMFPELNHTNIFVLQERPEFLLEQIEGFLAETYTYEDWLADVARFPLGLAVRRSQNQNQIASIHIPDSVIHIGAGAFSGNQLTSVAFPDSVTYIGTHAFGWNQLTNVIIGEGVVYIGLGAFAENQLNSVAIPIDTLIHNSFDPGVTVTRVSVAPAIYAQRNPESTLVGRWGLSDVNVPRNMVANYLEFFDDRTGLLTGYIPWVGRQSQGFTWRVDSGRLIITSHIGVEVLSIIELSRITLSYEMNNPHLGNIRATFIRSR